MLSRRVGDVTVVTCTGRIVAGDESTALQSYLDNVMTDSRHILLHLAGVDFIDSAGLGLLARNFMRVQNTSGTLKICAVSPKIDDVLRITRLKAVFQPYESESDPIAEVHARDDNAVANPDVLCVDASDDVLAYLRELLRGAGYRPITAANLPDGLILLRVTRPRRWSSAPNCAPCAVRAPATSSTGSPMRAESWCCRPDFPGATRRMPQCRCSTRCVAA